MNYNILFYTAPSEDEALHIAEKLINQKLVACVGVIPSIRSVYWWKGKVESVQECFGIAKTRSDRVDEAISIIKKYHSYEVPEIISLQITKGLKDYLNWIDESLER